MNAETKSWIFSLKRRIDELEEDAVEQRERIADLYARLGVGEDETPESGTSDIPEPDGPFTRKLLYSLIAKAPNSEAYGGVLVQDALTDAAWAANRYLAEHGWRGPKNARKEGDDERT